MERRKSREVTIGSVTIGGNHPVAVQSMTNTKTENIAATVDQIHRLTERGCEIIRCAVPTLEAAQALKEIRKQIAIPLVADIHFDYRLALEALRSGVDAFCAYWDTRDRVVTGWKKWWLLPGSGRCPSGSG